MNEFLAQFLVEGRELVEQGTSDLLELEQNPADSGRLDGAFRAFHTLKGAAGIVDFAAMSRALHAVEDALAAIRAGKRAVSTSLITQCLVSLDQVTAWLNAIEAIGDIPADAEAAADKIVSAFSAPVPAQEAAAHRRRDDVAHVHELVAAQIALAEVEGEGRDGRLASAVRVAANALRFGKLTSEANLILEAGRPPMDQARIVATLRQIMNALVGAAEPAAQQPGDSRDEGAARVLRVEVARINALVKLTGEITTAKNAIGHVVDQSKTESSMLREHYARLETLIGELQFAVLNLRVLPMRQVFQRFHRLVREMSGQFDKPARLITEGETTEADKVVVDALFDPLLHVIRNALDHGIEPAALRAARGKPTIASIFVRAFRAGEHVVVEVEDDGGGADVARIRALAVERGLVSAEAAKAFSDEEALELIFTPGFSTAATVTAVSGRGVGMDAVRAAIEAIGGQVSVENRPEEGMVVRFLLPFTLMVTRVMLVHAGAQAFGIPIDAVVESVRVRRGDIAAIGAARAFAYRDRTVPIIDLPAALGAPSNAGESAEATLVVTVVGGELTAFEVDRVASGMDVMLSPLDGLLSGVEGVAGATLLGDGSVLIVLDLHQLAK